MFFNRRVGDDAVAADQESVAVARGLGGRGGTDHSARTGTVLDHDGLPQPLADGLGGNARNQVVGAARPEGHDPSDRPLRPLGARRRRGERADKNRYGSEQKSAYHATLLGIGRLL